MSKMTKLCYTNGDGIFVFISFGIIKKIKTIKETEKNTIPYKILGLPAGLQNI